MQQERPPVSRQDIDKKSVGERVQERIRREIKELRKKLPRWSEDMNTPIGPIDR